MGVISALLRQKENNEDFIELFIFLHRNSANKSKFLLSILVEILEFQQAFLVFN